VRPPPLLLLACTLLGTGCKTGEPWAFGLTKTVNESGVSEDLIESSMSCERGDEVALAIIFAPFLIDIVLLPVTLTHDAVACK
jgi:hypothetical protein